MKKIIQKFFQMLSNPSGKLILSQRKVSETQPNNVRYFKARYFYNDLDDAENYYLRVRTSEKNVFVKKDEVEKNGNLY